MNILLIEDEALAAERTAGLLQEIDPSLTVQHTCRTVKNTVAWLSTHPEPDLIISDIQLLDGISFSIFQEHPVACPIIFLTAFDQYAIRAFEVNSIAYLLKPVERDKLEKALDKYRQVKEAYAHHRPVSQEVDYEKVMKALLNKTADYKSRYLVKVGQHIKAVSVDKIAYFYTMDKMTYLTTHDGRRFPLDHSLEEISKSLDPHTFHRLNRKYIASIEAVSEVQPYFKGRLVVGLLPDPEEEIVVSSEKSGPFKDWLDQ
ncbi:MAG: LytTR family DNA-binding domain-containing protein [Cyclobacteriaceae bacterium]